MRISSKCGKITRVRPHRSQFVRQWQSDGNMSTVNGIGTTRYDWQRRPDGTAEATVWFVIFFFPIIPLRREHLRVVGSGIRRSGFLETVSAFLGAGVGYQTSIELLGSMPLAPIGVLRTWFMGFVIVPFVTIGLPMLLMVGSLVVLNKFGMQPNAVVNKTAPVVGIGGLLWAACFVAWILDRSAGRKHVFPGASEEEQSQTLNRTAGPNANGESSSAR